jgi:hypothetical protein
LTGLSPAMHELCVQEHEPALLDTLRIAYLDNSNTQGADLSKSTGQPVCAQRRLTYRRIISLRTMRQWDSKGKRVHTHSIAKSSSGTALRLA